MQSDAGSSLAWAGRLDGGLDNDVMCSSHETEVDLKARIAALESALSFERDERARVSQALAAAGMVGTWYGDLQRGIVFGDESFARLYGVPPAETASGKPLGFYFQFMHPEDVAGATKARDDMIGGSDEFFHEHRVIRPDGTVLWVMARGRLTRDAAGAPKEFSGVSVDMTARKNAERRDAFLLALEARLRHMTKPEDVMFTAAEQIGSHLAADRAGYAALDESGGTAEVSNDWCARGMLSIAGTHGLSQFGALKEVLSSGQCLSIADAEHEVLTPARGAEQLRTLSVAAAITVPLIRNGRIAAVFFVHSRVPRAWQADELQLCRDVAERTWPAVERVKAEQIALQNAKEFELLSQAMSNHVWTARPDGWCDWYNAQAVEYSGKCVEDLSGDGWRGVAHPEDVDRVAAAWRSAITLGDDHVIECRLRRHDGIYRWHLVRAVPVRQNGQIVRWIGTNTDIDDQKAAAEALSALNATLESQVRERTAELMAAEETLRQSQKMEAVGQLTGGLAHDFNNLLAGISGSLDLLDRRLAQKRYDELPRYLDVAQRAAERAASLTHRLLAFSRRQALDPRPTDVNSLIAGMEDLIRRTVGPAIELDVMHGERLWTVHADPHQLENALLNLCINARDAMPDGGRITIEASNAGAAELAANGLPRVSGNFVLLRVADTGIGMSKEVAERAFDPFFTTKPLGEGTGLGLSMVYGFVRQSGGHAKIVSAPGEGAQILLYLPRHAGESVSTPKAAKPAGAPATGNGETVLVVDDEPNIRMLIREVLDELGYGVLEAVNGQKGLEILESSGKIELLVTDVGLPGGMNGRQLADLALRTRPDMKVLFITGYAETAVVGNAALPPGMHLVTKPFSLQTLAKRIKAILDGVPA